MAHPTLSLTAFFKNRAAMQAQAARFAKQEAQAVALLDRQLRPLGFRIERIEASSHAPARDHRRGRRASTQNARCPVAKCGRTFRYAMHLGRHLKAVHGK